MLLIDMYIYTEMQQVLRETEYTHKLSPVLLLGPKAPSTTHPQQDQEQAPLGTSWLLVLSGTSGGLFFMMEHLVLNL